MSETGSEQPISFNAKLEEKSPLPLQNEAFLLSSMIADSSDPDLEALYAEHGQYLVYAPESPYLRYLVEDLKEKMDRKGIDVSQKALRKELDHIEKTQIEEPEGGLSFFDQEAQAREYEREAQRVITEYEAIHGLVRMLNKDEARQELHDLHDIPEDPEDSKILQFKPRK